MKAYTGQPEPVVTGPPPAMPPTAGGDGTGPAVATADTARAAQRRTDRLLLLVLGGVVTLLLIAGLSLVFLRQPTTMLPADTPGGTVQRFLMALEKRDYDQAYNYLSNSMSYKPTREGFALYQMGSGSYAAQSERRRIGQESIYGDNATVEVIVTEFNASPDPFGGGDEYTYTEPFTLKRENGAWLITDLPWRYRGSY